MFQRLFLLCCFFGLFFVSSSYTIPGVPDARDLHVKISRSSGTGRIPFGYAVVVVIALALFVLLMGVIICYRSDKTPRRSEEKTIFLTRF